MNRTLAVVFLALLVGCAPKVKAVGTADRARIPVTSNQLVEIRVNEVQAAQRRLERAERRLDAAVQSRRVRDVGGEWLGNTRVATMDEAPTEVADGDELDGLDRQADAPDDRSTRVKVARRLVVIRKADLNAARAQHELTVAQAAILGGANVDVDVYQRQLDALLSEATRRRDAFPTGNHP